MRSLFPYLALIGILSTISAVVVPQQLRQRPPEQSPRTVGCRVLEAHASLDPEVTVVVFHQRDKTDADRLGPLLRHSSGEIVEFEAGDGSSWQRATVFRLKSCFGRGLLIVPTGAAQLKEGDNFSLKFPSD